MPTSSLVSSSCSCGTERSASSAAQASTDGSATPDSRSAVGTWSHSSSTRSTCRSASVRPDTASASRAARSDASSASTGRPARPSAAPPRPPPPPAPSVRARARRSCTHLALPGQQRPVDRLGEQRVAEAEGAGRMVGDEHVVLDRLAQRARELQLGERRHGVEQPVGDVAAGDGGDAQDGGRVAARAARRGRAARRAGPAAARSRRGRRRPAARARRTGSPQRARRWSQTRSARQRARASPRSRRRESGSSASGLRGAAGDETGDEAVEVVAGADLVAAIGRDEQDPPPADRVAEERDEVERGLVRPLEVLQHEQRGIDGVERAPRAPPRRAPVASRPVAARAAAAATAGQQPRQLAHAGERRRAGGAGAARRRAAGTGRPVPTSWMQRPDRTVAPRAPARAASSAVRRVFPSPARPATNTVVPACSSAASSRPSSSPRPTKSPSARRAGGAGRGARPG